MNNTAFFEKVFFRRPRVGNSEDTDEVSMKIFYSKWFKSNRQNESFRDDLRTPRVNWPTFLVLKSKKGYT